MEVLIAVVIVGIASAMLIPRLMGTTSGGMRNAKVGESVSLIKQLLSNAQTDDNATGQNWATYMGTQLCNQFGVTVDSLDANCAAQAVSRFNIIDGNGCSGAVTGGYTDTKMVLKDGAIIRILSNGVVGTKAGEIDVCIDPTGDTYSTAPAATMGRATSNGYTAVIDLTQPTLRMNVALSELPRFTCLPEPGEHHQSGIIIAPTLAYGATHNPWNQDYTPGGSSSGAAVSCWWIPNKVPLPSAHTA